MHKSTLVGLFIWLLFCVGCATNPLTGKQELMFIAENEDIALGRQYAPEIEKELGGKIDDPELQNYINTIGLRIARLSQRPYFEYSFAALDHDSTNAFALPGGYIYITRGMLELLESESQLAAILAHETVHVVARDVANAMSNQIGMTLLLAAMASAGAPGEAVQAADMAQQIIGLKFSRDDEREADLGGLDYMVSAGYDPAGMVETMQILESLQETRPIEFFSTHPSPENRIGYISEKIQQKFYGIQGLKAGREEYRKSVLERLKNRPGNKFEVMITRLISER